jgi:hypothetical protein
VCLLRGPGRHQAIIYRMGDSASTRVSTVLCIYAIPSSLGLWRWAWRRGYVLLRIHVGGVERGVIEVVILYVLLGDTGGISRRVSRGAGVEGG